MNWVQTQMFLYGESGFKQNLKIVQCLKETHSFFEKISKKKAYFSAGFHVLAVLLVFSG